MHKEIFSLCYYGHGGFTWNEVYNLPIHIRRYYIKLANDEVEKAKEQQEKQSSSNDAALEGRKNAKLPHFKRK